VLGVSPIIERCFPDWSMACCDGAEALSKAGISLAELAERGQAAIQSTLLLLQQAMDGQHRRSRLLGELPIAKPALVT
jgi:hypothetical protein